MSDVEVNSLVERNLQFFAQQYNTTDLVEVANKYGFDNIESLRKELFGIEKENALIQREQAKITENIDVTPEEVRIYYNGLKDKGELPEFPAEIQLGQLTINALPTEQERQRVITKLQEIKKEVEEGSSFKMKAIINSDDPAVASNGGQYPVSKEANLVKEFKEVAFSLDIDQISEPFKTDYGYHIMQLHEIKGSTRIVSHILMELDVPEQKLTETKKKVEDIKKDIESGKITFEEAVKKYSQDKATRLNGGVIVNPSTGETTFDLNRMDPALYARVNNLKKSEITDVFYDETREGSKMFKILVMKDRTNTHKAELVNDYVKIQRLALQKKREETITKWSKEKINDTYIKISNDLKKCTFDNNWKKQASN